MYVKAPVAPGKAAPLRQTMQAHGATVCKIREGDSSDHWWMICFPEGTTREEKKPEGEVRIYTVQFPDGYRFEYEAGILGKHGVFTRDPVLFVNQPEMLKGKQAESKR